MDIVLVRCTLCGGMPILCEPNYADDRDTMVVCEDCDAHTDGFVFGEFREGSIEAAHAWNNGDINPGSSDNLSSGKVSG